MAFRGWRESDLQRRSLSRLLILQQRDNTRESRGRRNGIDGLCGRKEDAKFGEEEGKVDLGRGGEE